MARYLIEVAGTYGGLRYERGQTAELTAAQVTAIGAANLRAASNPLNVNGSQAGSQTHDLAGEAAGVSNSS
jgi:hypothetical protein